MRGQRQGGHARRPEERPHLDSDEVLEVARSSRDRHNNERELLGIVWAIAQWKHYFQRPHTLVVQTDHTPLRHLPNQASVNSRVWKWINILQGYDLELRHIPGKKNPADSLSQQHFADACKQRNEVKEEEEDLVSVLRIKPQATNDDIQNALSRIFAGKESESDAVSIVKIDQAQDQNQRADTVDQSDGPEPTAHLSVLSSAVRLEPDLKERMKAALSTEYPYSEILQELE